MKGKTLSLISQLSDHPWPGILVVMMARCTEYNVLRLVSFIRILINDSYSAGIGIRLRGG